MNAEQARKIYFENHLDVALEKFYVAIGETAQNGLSGNFYDVAVEHDYAILALVKKQLESQGYSVAYSDGEIRSTKIFRISWD